jgi:hypothetical protein
MWDAFKNIAILFSFAVNLVLVLIIIALVPQSETLFDIKSQVAEPLFADLDQAFVALGDTTIQSTVYITDTIPVAFDISVDQATQVVLTEPVPLSLPATFFLPGGGGTLNGTVSFNLPQGQALPVQLSVSAPVSTTVPVIIQAPLEIKLDEAGMGPAIEQLRAVLRPATNFVQSLPDSTEDLLQGDE